MATQNETAVDETPWHQLGNTPAADEAPQDPQPQPQPAQDDPQPPAPAPVLIHRLQAPRDVTGISVEGVEYDLDEDGWLETDNEVVQRAALEHGFKPEAQVEREYNEAEAAAAALLPAARPKLKKKSK